jgi:hypothetical protein
MKHLVTLLTLLLAGLVLVLVASPLSAGAKSAPGFSRSSTTDQQALTPKMSQIHLSDSTAHQRKTARRILLPATDAKKG